MTLRCGSASSDDQLRLHPVRVLELIDQDVAEAAGDRGPSRCRLAHEAHGERHLVAEVDESVRGQQVLIARERTGQLRLPARVLAASRDRVIVRVVRGRRQRSRVRREPLGVCRVGRRRDVLVLAPAEEGREGAKEAGRVAERPVFVELELVEVLAQEDHDLGAGQDADIRRQAELECVLADQSIAEGVERRDRGVRVAVRNELVDAERHLGRGLVRERQREDLRGLRPARGDQPRDAAGDDLRLARAGPRDHEQRPIPVRHRAELVGVQAAEQGLHPARGGRSADDRRVHDRHQLTPGRDLFEGHRPAPPRAHDGAGHGEGLRSWERGRRWGPCADHRRPL